MKEELEKLFSENTVITVVCPDTIDPNFTLLPEEENVVSESSSTKRRTEFLMGRAAAVQALNKLNLHRSAILKGTKGEPLWPPGICGSISHSANFAVAAASMNKHTTALGIDIQQYKNLPSPNIFEKVLTKTEMVRFNLQNHKDQLDALRVFSAKEAIYKAISPLVKHRLSFKDISFCPSPHCPNILLGVWSEACRSRLPTGFPEATAKTKIDEEFIFSGVELGAKL